jgi:hypothetical protein
MEQGLTTLLLFVLGAICVLSLFLIIEALFGEIVEKTERAAQDTPGRSFLIGLVNFLFFGLVGIGLDAFAQNIQVQVLRILPLIFFVVLIIGLVFGLVGMAALVSKRLFPEQMGWRKTASGASVLTLACLTPYIGWFALLPYLGLRGLGGFVLACFTRDMLDLATEAEPVD